MAIQLIGESRAFKGVRDAITMVAPVDAAVLLSGETGTGKEMVARAIHEAGPRRSEPFVAINCAAIPAGLLESELFGHERGAFTGAVARSAGRFQSADRGTLFLDEIGDLPLELQPKLLRALQEHQIERLGSGGRSVPVDVRVIAATHQNLFEMVERREFRADLYYRLSVIPIALPPLRERAEDVRLLVASFVRRFSERHAKVIEHVPDSVIEALQSHTWPGNIRELQNVIERAVIATRGNVLEVPGFGARSKVATPGAKTLADVEREYIQATLDDTKWVVGGWNGAASRLGLSRTTLIAKMQRLGISRARTQVKSYRRPARGAGGEVRPTPIN